jgi:hypothetical protein
MMATVADCMPPAFIISTGDNFYSREYLPSDLAGSAARAGALGQVAFLHGHTSAMPWWPSMHISLGGAYPWRQGVW